MYCERLCVGGRLTDGEDGFDRRSCSCERTTRERERELHAIPSPSNCSPAAAAAAAAVLSFTSLFPRRSLVRSPAAGNSLAHHTSSRRKRAREKECACVCERRRDTHCTRVPCTSSSCHSCPPALIPSLSPCPLPLLLLSSRPAKPKRGRRAVAFSVSLSRSHPTREQETRGIEKGVLSLVTRADVDQSRVSPSQSDQSKCRIRSRKLSRQPQAPGRASAAWRR